MVQPKTTLNSKRTHFDENVILTKMLVYCNYSSARDCLKFFFISFDVCNFLTKKLYFLLNLLTLVFSCIILINFREFYFVDNFTIALD